MNHDVVRNFSVIFIFIVPLDKKNQPRGAPYSRSVSCSMNLNSNRVTSLGIIGRFSRVSILGEILVLRVPLRHHVDVYTAIRCTHQFTPVIYNSNSNSNTRFTNNNRCNNDNNNNNNNIRNITHRTITTDRTAPIFRNVMARITETIVIQITEVSFSNNFLSPNRDKPNCIQRKCCTQIFLWSSFTCHTLQFKI